MNAAVCSAKGKEANPLAWHRQMGMIHFLRGQSPPCFRYTISACVASVALFPVVFPYVPPFQLPPPPIFRHPLSVGCC